MALRLYTPIPSLQGITEWVNHDATQYDLADKFVLVHFWSISCHTCKESFGEIKQMMTEFSDLVVIGIHMPRSEEDLDIAAVHKVISNYNLRSAQGIDNEHNVVDAFENEYVPAFYLYDKQNRLRHRSAGEHGFTTLKRAFEKVRNE